MQVILYLRMWTCRKKGWGIGVSYSRPGDYFVRLDWARRIGLGKNASDAAKSKNRFWFMVGKVW